MQQASRGSRIRARRALPRPARGALGDPGRAGHQHAVGRGGGRLRPRRAGGPVLRRGVLLPQLAELGQPRLFPEGRQDRWRRPRCSRRSSRSSTTTSRRRASSCSRTRSRMPSSWRRRSRRGPGAGSRSTRPQRGERRQLIEYALRNAKEALGRRLADTASQQKLLASLGAGLRPDEGAAAGRGLRQLAHHGHQRGRRHDRRRRRRLHEAALPHLQHALGGPDARRRLRHDARDAAAAASRAW